MSIHHSQARKAEKMGVTLTEQDDLVVAFWPKRALKLVGPSAGDALTQMQAAIAVLTSNPDIRIMPDPDVSRLVWGVNMDDMIINGCPMTPVDLHRAILGGAAWVPNGAPPDQQDGGDPAPDAPEQPTAEVERINGIAIDGGVAYKEGTLSADCPYSSEEGEDGEDSTEYDNFVRWNEEWDAAADAAEDEEEKHGGSVVSEKYRAIYAERGHPTHCGDWLAELLNNLCITEKSGTDLDRFEAICQLNGVDTGKYKRSGIGWQGRIRMTGRNLLAKKVYAAGGILKVPTTDHPDVGEPPITEFKAPADWMASQKYKMPKAQQKTVVAYAGKN